MSMHAMATLDMRIVSLEVMVSMREKLFHAHPDRQSLSIHKGNDDIRMSDPKARGTPTCGEHGT
jgi:hypothetical protein